MIREAIDVVSVLPDLLGTYGDEGNCRVLERRAAWRGIKAKVIRVLAGEPLPRQADIYCLGGGEDAPQAAAARLLGDGALEEALERGAVVVAICAGFQILGQEFRGPGGKPMPGLGLVPIRTSAGMPRRAVGELVVEASRELDQAVRTACPWLARSGPLLLVGYENHAGRTHLVGDARPLGRVRHGVGNGEGRLDGIFSERLIGSYMHGPMLARNPEIADLALSWVVGPLEPLDDAEVVSWRMERLRAAGVAEAR
jgi:CobQ-like glutamine amidotransferase family enzyme